MPGLSELTMDQARQFLHEMRHYIADGKPSSNNLDIYKIQLLAGSLKTAIARVDELEAMLPRASAAATPATPPGAVAVTPSFWDGTVVRNGIVIDTIIATFTHRDGRSVLAYLEELSAEMSCLFWDHAIVAAVEVGKSVTIVSGGEYKVTLTRKA